jgi:hypothetical protein
MYTASHGEFIVRAFPCLAAVLLAVAPARAQEKQDDGFVPMFNGKDLTGWVNVNCAPGTFFVKDGEVITTGKPTGYLRTEKQYENFIADFEWMHVNTKEVGNSGFFVWADPLPAVGTPYTRGIEVQVLVNLEREGYYTSQGDLFSIHGATCKPDRPHPHGWERCLPSERRCKGGGEWNHYVVIAQNGVIKLHVNGKEVSGLSQCNPRKGYLALESEGAECHFRNLKIKELPSNNAKPEETAHVAEGFRNLFTGLDLSGWKADDSARAHWQPRDWILRYDGKGAALATEKAFGAAEFIVDFHFPKGNTPPAPCVFVFREGPSGSAKLSLTADGQFNLSAPGANATIAVSGTSKDLKPAGQWNRLGASLHGTSFQVTVNGKPLAQAAISGQAETGPLVLRPEGAMEFGNLFVRQRKD